MDDLRGRSGAGAFAAVDRSNEGDSGAQGTPNARSGVTIGSPAPPQAARGPPARLDRRPIWRRLAAGRGTRRRHPAQLAARLKGGCINRGGGTVEIVARPFFRRRDAEARQTHGDSQEGLRRDLRGTPEVVVAAGRSAAIDPRAPRSQQARSGDAESSGGRDAIEILTASSWMSRYPRRWTMKGMAT